MNQARHARTFKRRTALRSVSVAVLSGSFAMVILASPASARQHEADGGAGGSVTPTVGAAVALPFTGPTPAPRPRLVS